MSILSEAFSALHLKPEKGPPEEATPPQKTSGSDLSQTRLSIPELRIKLESDPVAKEAKAMRHQVQKSVFGQVRTY
jgi:hypothetical protein